MAADDVLLNSVAVGSASVAVSRATFVSQTVAAYDQRKSDN